MADLSSFFEIPPYMPEPSIVNVHKWAVISDDGLYRYYLERDWGKGRKLYFLMYNPSTADGKEDDPTINRCIDFAKRNNYTRIGVINLYAYRAADPKDLLKCQDPIGPKNFKSLEDAAKIAKQYTYPIVCAFGNNSEVIKGHHKKVIEIFNGCNLLCLGTNKNGSPKHPLYIKSEQQLLEWKEYREKEETE